MTGALRQGILRQIAAAAVLAFIAPGVNAAEVEWKFFTYFPTNDKPAQTNRAFAEDLLKASDGRFKITVYSAGELPYKNPDAVKIVATNQVQMADAAVGFVAGDVPQLNVFSLPFLCTSYDEYYEAVPVVQAASSDLLMDKFDIRVAMHWTMPPQNLWLGAPISGLGEIEGLKIRTWNPLQVEAMKLLGASPVSISSAEVIQALERRVIDGAITSALSASDWKAYQITKAGYMWNITMGDQFILINEGEFRKLPPDLQELLTAKAKEWAPKYRAMSEQGNDAARRTLVANGVTLQDPSTADLDHARKLMRPMWEEWAKQQGPLAAELLDKVSATCAG